ncbi:uncharacterized protein LOC112589860 [Harpegnathos saltator]|uniref:uncharacterized protein LOC112589860 n=1 Tax=Harpegnathos saltator TaxID=610380 RepID=UPI000DBEF1AE|nr:uncharacterized protein LOC112589860 [Harpegnathos saltator]XP_025160487.1 uncharacterized protein LOC112589860 [Harpegnathos saltator]
MGLKWFRARLSINKKGAYKISTMPGIYRRVSYSESNTLAMRKNEYSLSTVSSSIANDSTNANNKEDLTSQSQSLNTDLEHDEYVAQNEELVASIKELKMVKQSSIYEEETNETNEDQNHVSNMKDSTCQETELVI